jgi:hypothetical protein
MGWLSLATRVLPKVWRAGVKATSKLFEGGSKVAGATGNVLGAAARNPKTTAVAGVAAYAGWRQIGHPEESLGTSVGKTLRSGTDGTGDFAHDVVNGYTGEKTVEEVKDTTKGVLDGMKDTVSETKGILGTLGDTLKGISTFLGNLFSGNGTGMFGNFFNNISSGNVSGLSIGGLIMAGYMMFARTGLLGKIGGALLAMMMIGGNSHQHSQSQGESENQQLAEERQQGMHR